jgi:hypothetical protein
LLRPAKDRWRGKLLMMIGLFALEGSYYSVMQSVAKHLARFAD